jgi:AmiR/NasT family two-component response regulator
VEQAKGVLAYVEQVDMETAFDLLSRRSHENGGSLTATALEVVREQYE